MKIPRNPLVGLILRYFTRLRWPVVFVITGVLFLVDMAVPDFIPLADEILLGLGTVLFGILKKKKQGGEEEIENGESEADSEFDDEKSDDIG